MFTSVSCGVEGNTNTLSHSHDAANMEHSSGDNNIGGGGGVFVVTADVVVVGNNILKIVIGFPPLLGDWCVTSFISATLFPVTVDGCCCCCCGCDIDDVGRGQNTRADIFSIITFDLAAAAAALLL